MRTFAQFTDFSIYFLAKCITLTITKVNHFMLTLAFVCRFVNILDDSCVVLTFANVSRLMLTFANVSRLMLTFANVSRLMPTFANVSRLMMNSPYIDHFLDEYQKSSIFHCNCMEQCTHGDPVELVQNPPSKPLPKAPTFPPSGGNIHQSTQLILHSLKSLIQLQGPKAHPPPLGVPLIL